MTDKHKSPEKLWQDYLFLTRQMHQFLQRDNVDMFLELLAQREKLQAAIEAADTGRFKTSAAGVELFAAIRQADAVAMQELERLRNTMQRREDLSVAYEGMRARPLGRRMDEKG
jgi:hypothetical protein